MRWGKGSVTRIWGISGLRATASPNQPATFPAQAPAQLKRRGLANSRPSAVVRQNSPAVTAPPVISVRSRISTPAPRAASAKAGETSRGLAWPSSAAREPPTTSSPSQGKRARIALRPRGSKSRPKPAASRQCCSMTSISASLRARRRWPVTVNSPSVPMSRGSSAQRRRARLARGSSPSARPCWRTPPKFTPLARCPARSRSRSRTERPLRRRCSAVEAPAMPAPSTMASARITAIAPAKA
jgi:hypothetical protein